jgi:hypothetical protein
MMGEEQKAEGRQQKAVSGSYNMVIPAKAGIQVCLSEHGSPLSRG